MIPAAEIDLDVSRALVSLQQVARDDARIAEAAGAVTLLFIGREFEHGVHRRVVHHSFAAVVIAPHRGHVVSERRTVSQARINHLQNRIARFESGLTVGIGQAGDACRRGGDIERSVETVEIRSEEHTSELQSLTNILFPLLLYKKKK